MSEAHSTPKTFYVYVLSYPDGRPFYVGKGTGRRITMHEIEARQGHRCHKCNVIRKIWRQGGQVARAIVFETSDAAEAYRHERDLIAHYGRSALANGTDGGVGGTGHSSSERARDGVRARNRALWDDPQARAIRIAAMSKANRDPHTVARRSASNRGKKRSAAIRAAISARARGRSLSPEAAERLRSFSLQATPDAVRRKMGEAARALSPEAKARQRDGQRAFFEHRTAEDPAYQLLVELIAAGLSSADIVERTGFHKNTVNRWKRKLR